MSRFLDLAYEVLSQEGNPLSVDEIIEIASARGLLVSSGQTPSQSIREGLTEWELLVPAAARDAILRLGLRERLSAHAGLRIEESVG